MEKLKIKFHYSFWIFAGLLIYFQEYILLLSMVISVVLHEMGHYIVAKKLGYKLNNINLLPYGASLSGEDTFIESKDEIIIAISGPLTSLFISIIFIALWWVFPTTYNFTSTFVYTNLSIFLVNFLPCYPLDGARIISGLLKSKFPQKKCLKISKVISFVTLIILLILYIVSCFVRINYSLCMFIIFLSIGLFFCNDNEKYTLQSRTFSVCKNQKNGIKVNIKAISNQSSLLELYKILEPSALNYILVLDKLNNTTMTLKDKEIEQLLLKYSLDTCLCNIPRSFNTKA